MSRNIYYEDYQPSKKRAKRAARRGRDDKKSGRGSGLRRLLRPLLRLTCLLLIAVLAAAAVLYFLPGAVFMIEPETDVAPAADLPTGTVNILVLGVDALNSGTQRSDAMMIASIDRSGLRLTSLQRDVVVDIDGYGRNKLNAAYAFGGPELAMRTVNQVYGMNILGYVTVDFTALVRMVDALGGIPMDITESERDQININVWDSRRVFRPLGYTARKLMVSGDGIILDGLQTLGFARIRKTDSDFVRTSRQRRVISAMIGKLKANLWNIPMLIRFTGAALSGISSDLPAVELISLGEKVLLSGSMTTLRVPVDGSFEDDGSKLLLTDREANVAALRAFIYGG